MGDALDGYRSGDWESFISLEKSCSEQEAFISLVRMSSGESTKGHVLFYCIYLI